MQPTVAKAFLDLHRPGDPLLCPNPWDVGSARVLASLGFRALATTSSGFAATLGQVDGYPGPEQSLAAAAAIAAAVPVPVTADLEDGYSADAEGVAGTVRDAIAAGLAGCSIEDWSAGGVYPREVAAARVEAAAAAAGDAIVLTARADNHVHSVQDLGDTIHRLQAFEAAGAHVLYAPGLETLDQVEAVLGAVSQPVNFLMRPGGPNVRELAAAGIARITVGGAFAFAALGALTEAAIELRDSGTTDFARLSAVGQRAARDAFSTRDA
jgi:2-methylisocitrate lyase-like PEP mutase family enzyme